MLPLSELRRAVLEEAEQNRNGSWMSTQLWSWAMREGLASATYQGDIKGVNRTLHLTERGALVLKLDREHGFRMTSTKLGGSSIKGLPDRTGTRISCRCGWSTTANESRTGGGAARLRREHRDHVAAVQAEAEKGLIK